METRKFRRKPAIRLRVPAQPTVCVDGLSGACSESVLDLMGDFVLRRGDGVFSYQFAVAVDDSAMEISEVVRGADLAASASCQVLLMRLLGAPAPRYWHVPLLCDNLGERFSKRQASLSVRTLRNRGIPPTTILAALCDLYGIACHAGASPLLAAARALETPSPDVMSILTGPSLRLAEGALG